MVKRVKTIIVVCEGASENAYIQELNRFLDENKQPFRFIAKPSNGGMFSHVIRKYNEIRRDNSRTEVLIWVDWDRYCRNDNGDKDNYDRKAKGIPDFLFSYHNFEDFLVMHFDRSIVDEWVVSCISRDHFKNPSHSKEYEKAFNALIKDAYIKGELPIEINSNTLKHLREHQNDSGIFFTCGFAQKFLELIDQNS